MDSLIVSRLQANARESWASLGQAAGVTGPAIAERVRKLEERGLIKGYTAVLDADALGYGLLAFIAVSLERPTDRAGFLARIQALAEVQECHHIAGDDDYLLKVRCRSTSDLERLITDGLKSLPGVVKTRTTIVLGTAKETSALPIQENP